MRSLASIVFLILSLPLCFAQDKVPQTPIQKAYAAAQVIAQQTVASPISFCSATAIGPQALLTASHCEEATDTLGILGQETAATIVARIRDGKDHTIYLLDGVTFKYTAPVAPNKLDIGDPVFVFGSPGKFSFVYRHGVFSGVYQPDSGNPFVQAPEELLFDVQTFPGDSGEAVFNAAGQVVEVMSATLGDVYGTGAESATIQFGGAWPLAFTDEDYKRATTFTTPQKPAAEKK